MSNKDLQRWETASEWPLAACAVAFLVLYSIEVLAEPQGWQAQVVSWSLAKWTASSRLRRWRTSRSCGPRSASYADWLRSDQTPTFATTGAGGRWDRRPSTVRTRLQPTIVPSAIETMAAPATLTPAVLSMSPAARRLTDMNVS